MIYYIVAILGFLTGVLFTFVIFVVLYMTIYRDRLMSPTEKYEKLKNLKFKK